MSELPSNSHKNKDKSPRKHDKSIKGEVEIRKKPLTRKLSETIFNPDIKSAKNHLIQEYVIPGFLDFLSNGLHELVDTFINSDGRSHSYGWRGSGNAKSNTSYEKYFYKQTGASSDSKPSYEPARSPYDAYEYIFAERGEADRVLEDLRSCIEEFGVVSLNEYYELVGLTSELGSGTDSNFGWRNLDRVTISTIRNRGKRGYVINLPRLEQIN